MLGLAAIQLGVVQSALRDTAAYIAQRKQFGRPIATFQGVALRAADAWIDVEALRAVVMQAAWQASAGRDAGAGDREPPSGGPPWPGSASSTPRSTCTAASAPTSSIPCTATSCGRSRTSCCSAARAQQAARLGAMIASAEGAADPA